MATVEIGQGVRRDFALMMRVNSALYDQLEEAIAAHGYQSRTDFIEDALAAFLFVHGGGWGKCGEGDNNGGQS